MKQRFLFETFYFRKLICLYKMSVLVLVLWSNICKMSFFSRNVFKAGSIAVKISHGIDGIGPNPLVSCLFVLWIVLGIVEKKIKLFIFGKKGPSGFSISSTAEEVSHGIDGTGLTAIVTGASSGIGIETARVLALRGVHVVMAVRNMDAGKDVKEAIIKEIPYAKIEVMELDLSSMASVRNFASEYISSGLPLNLLINNAGIMGTAFKLSQFNVELQFATNHLGHFLLTNLLLETMKNTAQESNIEGRIVNLSSEGHRFVYREGIGFDKINDESGYNGLYAYGQSKLANLLHANELARRLKEEGVNITANAVHPGLILTKIVRHRSSINGLGSIVAKKLFKNVQQGAATTCYVALHPQVKGLSGEYFVDGNTFMPSSQAKDAKLAKKLWDFSVSLISLS